MQRIHVPAHFIEISSSMQSDKRSGYEKTHLIYSFFFFLFNMFIRVFSGFQVQTDKY